MKSFDSLEEIREWLVPKGFYEYKPTPFHKDTVKTCFQKRYDDDKGKKYFIDVDIWDYSWSDRIPENYIPEIRCQLYQTGTHDAFNITFISWEIGQAEEFVENMFQSGVIEHYETWEGYRGE